ncbi:MAG: hypothetical protein ACFFBP_22465 [Promethearchaeota archaeon]
MLQTIKDKLDKTFHKIFSNSHLIYTLLFLLIILLILLFSITQDPQIGNIALFIATTSALTFIFMMILSLYPNLEESFFLSEKIFEKRKVFLFLGMFLISFIIVLIYFFTGSSNQLAIQFLGWDLLLPIFFIIVYFGWNIVQIWFIKSGFEDISSKIDDKLIGSKGDRTDKTYLSILFLIIALLIPVLMQIGTLIGFMNYFLPQNPGDPLNDLILYIGWNVIMFIIIFLISLRLILLFVQSKKKNTPNIFSSIFYILIGIIIWFRSFNFVNSFQNVTSTLGVEVFTNLMDILLMLFTSIMLLRGLGNKVYKFRIFTPNNLPFFLFTFAILYIEGQVIMITGGGSISPTLTDFKQIKLVNNFIILLVTVIFYWWYAKYSLEQKELIFKGSFKPREVYSILKDFKIHLEKYDYLETNKIDDQDIKSFLKTKKIIILDDEKEKELKTDINFQDSNSNKSDLEEESLDIDIDDNLI